MSVKTFAFLCVLFFNIWGNQSEAIDNLSDLKYNGTYKWIFPEDLVNINESFDIQDSSLHMPLQKSSGFPSDAFSETQLGHGAIILHFFGAFYGFGVVGIVCGEYFLPSIDCICSDLNLSQDVAAATFMSFATTAPELFIILIATFITKTDIGIGAVVGSGMFNILGVATIGGLAAITPIKLDWWPLYRDSLVYVLAPIILATVVADGQITLIEAIGLIAYYFIYFIIMFFNRKIRRQIKTCIKSIKGGKRHKEDKDLSEKQKQKTTQIVPTISLTVDDSKHNYNELSTVLNTDEDKRDGNEDNLENDGSFKAYFINYEDSRSIRRISACSTCSNKSNPSRKKSDRSSGLRKSSDSGGNIPNSNQANENLNFILPQVSDLFEQKNFDTVGKNEEGIHVCDESEILPPNFFKIPDDTTWNKFLWLVQWPAAFILYHTIPDCKLAKWRKFYPMTFLMCVFWIGTASYFGTWMISVIGDTMGIPDSVMGLTFLAFGGSMPEAVSTFIMARQGEGGLGFSNSLGGNTMDICLCLGMPWLINCIIHGPVFIESDSLQYNTVALVLGIIVLLTVVTHTKFYMNKTLGIVCCFFYLIFIIISVLIELSIIDVDVDS